jgi:hypothetical protein
MSKLRKHGNLFPLPVYIFMNWCLGTGILSFMKQYGKKALERPRSERKCFQNPNLTGVNRK